MRGIEGRDELAEYLDSLERESRFQVQRVLKESPSETTELVTCVAGDGPCRGPIIRKRLSANSADGAHALYHELAAAYKQGKRYRHLACVYDCYETGDETVVLMEYVEGCTLRELIRHTLPSVRLQTTLDIYASLVPAVAEFHAALGPGRLAVHRDLTPSNVICPAEDPASVKLIDFGIARVWHADADRDTRCFGTRPYAPPEQFGFGQTDVRTDVYALGLMLFYCLTGRDATQADRRAGFQNPAIPEPVRLVIVRAAQLDPQRRYADQAELAAALDRAARELDLAVVLPASSRGSAGAAESAIGQARFQAESAKSNTANLSYAALHADKAGAHAGDMNAEDSLPVELTANPRPTSSKFPDAISPRFAGLWNTAVIIFAGFFIFVSYIGLFDTSSGLLVNDTPLQRAFALGVFLPVLFGTLGYALLDRRRLWPRCFKRRPGPLWKKLLACLAILAVDMLGFLLVYLPALKG